MPRYVPYQAQTYSADEMNDLLCRLKGNELEDMVYLSAVYGMRHSKVCGLRWEDVDFKNGIIYVRHKVLEAHLDGTHELVKTNSLKTEASRRAYEMNDKIKTMLLRRKQWIQDNQNLWGNCYEHQYEEYVFVFADGSLMTPDQVSDRFRRFIANHKLKKIRFHDLRHSCATMLLREGFTLQEIQSYLGHATYQTTLRYAHLDSTRTATAAKRMDDILG